MASATRFPVDQRGVAIACGEWIKRGFRAARFVLAALGGLAFGSPAGAACVDYLNPDSPVILGGVSTPDYAVAVTCAGNYAYVSALSAGLQIVDISQPETPVIVGHASTGARAVSAAVSGSYAYVAEEAYGVEIVDLVDPADPCVIGRIPLSGWALDVATNGQTVC